MTIREKIDKTCKLIGSTQASMACDLGISEVALKRIKGSSPGYVSQAVRDRVEAELDRMLEHMRCVHEELYCDFSEEFENSKPDPEIVVEGKKSETKVSDDIKYIQQLEKKVQELMDKNRILRKSARKYNREETIHEAFINEVADAMKSLKPVQEVEYIHSNTDKIAIVQCSDWHMGTTVNLKNNQYNLDICHQRAMDYACKTIELLKSQDVNKVVIAITGDMYSLDDKNKDMLLSMEYNRGENFVRGVDIVSDFISIFVEAGYVVYCVGVVGNESRIDGHEYQTNIDALASNNFDAMMFKMMMRIFGERVMFINDGDVLNEIFTLNNKTFLFTHGDKIKNHNDQGISQYKSSMMEMFNLPIDYCVFGHLHSTLITPGYARSGSLMGANTYSQIGLGISGSIASQNVTIVGDDITTIQIKLS